MRLRFIPVILVISFTAKVGYAQKNSPEPTLKDIDITASNSYDGLIVMLQEADKEVIAKLEKKKLFKAVDYYKNLVAEINNNMKEVVLANWKYHDSVQFKTIEELKNIRSATSEKYLVLSICYFTFVEGSVANGSSGIYHYQYPTTAKWMEERSDKFEETGIKFTGGASVRNYEVYLLIQNLSQMNFSFPKINDIGSSLLHSRIPSKADLAMTLSSITNKIDAASKNPSKLFSVFYTENAKQIKDLILVIPESYFILPENYPFPLYNDYKEFVKVEDVGDLYSYKYEIVNDSIYEDIIIKKKTGYAYLHVDYLPADGVYMCAVITDAETGKLLLLAKPTNKIADDWYFKYFLHKNHFESIAYYLEKAN